MNLLNLFLFFVMNENWDIHCNNQSIYFTKNKQNITLEDNYFINYIKNM
jgi:hypothetical protein